MFNRTNQKGVSLIAAIFIIIVLAFMGVMFLSLVSKGSFSAVNTMQSAQALYVADGGIRYTLALNKNNIPNYSTHGIWTTLGLGEFKVDTISYLTATVNVGATSINVDSTNNFPASGRITIDSEFIVFTAKTANTFTVNAVTAPHNRYNSVYPAAQLLNPGLNGVCGTVNINVVATDDTGAFNIPGVIFIDNEYFHCSAKTATQFQNCQRCYAGSSPAAHPSTRFASQYVLTSTGRIINSISSTAQRIVQVNAGPLDE